MRALGQFMQEIQRDAAELPAGQLRTEIQVGLDVLTEMISHFRSVDSDAAREEEVAGAAENMMAAALFVALYVRELTSRPAPRYARVHLSFN